MSRLTECIDLLERKQRDLNTGDPAVMDAYRRMVIRQIPEYDPYFQHTADFIDWTLEFMEGENDAALD